MNSRSLRFLRALRVIARITAITQDHCGLVAGISTPHAGVVICRLAHEHPEFGGGSADGTGTCSGAQLELLAQFCNEFCLLPSNGLLCQTLVHQVVRQLAEAFSCLVSRL